MSSGLRGPAMALGLSDFRALAEIVRERAGLSFDEQSHFLFERRLGERAQLRGLPDFSTYAELLRRDPIEMDQVLELISTKETYFFRQSYQLTAFAQELLPDVASSLADYKRLTVWSAGCSSGEEAYTLAMLLSEAACLRGYQIQVVGTDLCQSNIDIARRGEYRRASFRVLPEGKLGRYFEEVTGGYRVSQELRKMCHFTKVNLTQADQVKTVGRMDVIFCRNVLIYFNELTKKHVTDLLFERLLPGGYLCLGHSESLLWSETGFETVHLSSDLIYRKPRQAAAPAGIPGARQAFARASAIQVDVPSGASKTKVASRLSPRSPSGPGRKRS